MPETDGSMAQSTIGVVGLGAFGGAVAARLVRQGFPLMVFDIASGPVQYLVMNHQADIAFSPRMMAETCDLVITALPSLTSLRETVFGTYGLALGCRPGFALVDVGKHDPLAVKSFADDCTKRGITFIEAPACGTAVDARAGTLVIPVAGDDIVIERLKPVLGALGEQVIRTGPPGSATAAAALVGYLRAAATLALGEALLVAERGHLSPAALLELSRALGFIAPAAERALRPREVSLSLAASHRLDLVVEDLDLVLELATTSGVIAELATACRKSWGDARHAMGSEEDHSAIRRWLEQSIASSAAAAAGTHSDPPGA
jgi:3-hydroxyisobutyrate dehydrogenase-like beta-hydroxyacid dehydrogenase